MTVINNSSISISFHYILLRRKALSMDLWNLEKRPTRSWKWWNVPKGPNENCAEELVKSTEYFIKERSHFCAFEGQFDVSLRYEVKWEVGDHTKWIISTRVACWLRNERGWNYGEALSSFGPFAQTKAIQEVKPHFRSLSKWVWHNEESWIKAQTLAKGNRHLK